jgi:ankyrin repeat protein
MQMLIDAGADLNIQDNDGLTPLHIAVSMNDFEAIKILIKAGSRKDIRDNKGRLPYELTTREYIKEFLS